MLSLRGDDVALLVLVEVQDSLDRDVVGLGGAGGEDNFLRGSADERSDLGASGFDGVFGFPAEEVGPGMRVAVARDIERQHSVEDTRVHR